EGASGITGAAPIWNSLMRTAHREKPAKFVVPDGLHAVEVCALSGMLPGPACSKRRIDWFMEENVPTEHCLLHSLVAMDLRTGTTANEATSVDQRAWRPTTAWPAEVLQWAIDQGLVAHEKVPVEASAGGGTMALDVGVLRLTSPVNGGLYRLSVEIPAENQRLLVSAVCELCDPSGRLVVELDGERWHEWSHPPYTAYWPLTQGEHVFSLVHEPGTGMAQRSESITITVVASAPQGGHKP
ncbi:MAG: hypothetical protein R6X16_16240, partial [Anaerolineae bacterium]